jgi:hypothetical protein
MHGVSSTLDGWVYRNELGVLKDEINAEKTLALHGCLHHRELIYQNGKSQFI